MQYAPQRVVVRGILLTAFFCLLAGITHSASLNENIIAAANNGVLEQYGSQHNSYPASRVHDSSTANFWLSANGNASNHFTFSFDGELEETFNFFRLNNYGNHNRSVQQFRLYASSDSAAKTDATHPSWTLIGVRKNGSGTLYNYLNSYTGGVLEQYGSQHNSYPASRVNNGGVSTFWLSANGNPDNYFIYSFENDTSALLNAFHLRNYGNHNRSVQNFMLRVSSDAAAKSDPDHASWIPVTGAVGTDPANLIIDDLGALEDYGSQHNSYPASRTNDGGYTAFWLSANGNVNNHFIYSMPDLQEYEVHTLKLYNYGNHNRSVKNFRMYTSTDDAAASDPDHASWVPTTGASTDLANLISSQIDGVLEKYGSQHNSYPASRVNDEGLTSYWLSANGNFDNYFLFSFPDGGEETFTDFDLYNYGNHNRSVKTFQLLYSKSDDAKNDPDDSSWKLISGNGVGAANLILEPLGGVLEQYGSQHNSYPASRTHDGGFSGLWLSANGNTNNYFIYSFPGTSAKKINQLDLYNYGNHNRSVKNFRLFTSNSSSGPWTAISGASGTDLVNVIGQQNGGDLTDYGSQHNSYPASRVNDQGLTSFWLSGNTVTDNYFIFEMIDGDKVDVDALKIYNYGNHNRSIQDIRIYTSTKNSSKNDPNDSFWTAVTGTGDANPANVLNIYMGATLEDYSSQHNSYPATRANDGGKAALWLSANGSTANQHMIFTMPDENQKAVNQLVLNNYGNHNRAIQDFTLWVSNTAAAKTDENHASWSAVTEQGGDATFTAAKAAGDQTFTFDGNYNATYFMIKMVNNYGDASYIGFQEIELYGTETLDDYGAVKVAKAAGEQTFTFDNQNNKSYLMVRVVSNYGDGYVGCYDMQAYGDSTTGDYGIYTANKVSGKQTFSFNQKNAKYFQFLVLDNYGDSYTGLYELQVFGTSTNADFGVFEAAKTAGKQRFTFSAPTPTPKYFQFKVLENYGDSYTGLYDLQLYGTKTVGEFAGFTAAKNSNEQTFNFTPITAKYFQLKVLNNYGDSYTGLRELELYGDTTIAELGIFKAAKAAGSQVFAFNDVSAKYLMMKILNNYGDSYTGIVETEVYGTATLAEVGVFEASKSTAWQDFYLNESTGNYFKMQVANNYGDSYNGLREIELYSVFDLILRDPVTNSETLTNRSVDSGESINVVFENVASDATDAMISEDVNFTGGVWVAINPSGGNFTLTHTLSTGDGLKTIYAKIRNAALDEESNEKTITLDTTAPPQADNFISAAEPGKITLNWDNPNDPDFKGVMLRYSTSSNPATATDGILMNTFEGSLGELVMVDHSNLVNGTTYYYSLFSYDEAGNYSDPLFTDALPLAPTAGFGIQVPATVVAGTDFVANLQVFRDDGTLDLLYAQTADLIIEYMDPTTGTLNITYTPIIFSEGISTTTINYPDAGSFRLSVVGNPDTALTGLSEPILSYPAQFTVTPEVTSVLAETAFAMTVIPLNALGGVTPNYTGTVQLEATLQLPVDGLGSLNQSQVGISGQTQVTELQFDEVGSWIINVQDATTVPGVLIQGTSATIVVIPQDIKIQVSSPPADRPFYYLDESFSVSLTVVSPNGNTMRNYRGLVRLASPFLNFNLEENLYTFTATDAGSVTFAEVVGVSQGAFPIQALDLTNNGVQGISDVIEVRFAQVRVVGTDGPVGSLQVSILIEDEVGNIITQDNATTFQVQITDPNNNGSSTSLATSQVFQVQAGEAIIPVSDTEAETVIVTPSATPFLEPVPGNVTFIEEASAPFAGEGGIRILYWGEERKGLNER